jgi:hypothetical protein
MTRSSTRAGLTRSSVPRRHSSSGCEPAVLRVGIIVGRDTQIYDSTARLISEFYTAGAGSIDHYIGGWSAPSGVKGYITLAGAPIALGDAVPGQSVVDGDQYDHQVAVIRAPECGAPGCVGGWWLAYDGAWIGHHPIGARASAETCAADPAANGCATIPFDLIDNAAQGIDWYGEIFDPTEHTWTSTDMGSPRFPQAGSATSFKSSAYFRALSGLDQASGAWQWANVANVKNLGGDDSNCYRVNIVDHTADDPNWRVTSWFGGPGADCMNACNPYP